MIFPLKKYTLTYLHIYYIHQRVNKVQRASTYVQNVATRKCTSELQVLKKIFRTQNETFSHFHVKMISL